MRHRWLAVSLGAATLVACADDPTGPETRPPLTLPQYALQLRGDPFLAAIAGKIGRPELATQIDDAVVALNNGRMLGSPVTSLFASAQASLAAAVSDSSGASLTEEDVLSAVVEVTLDRLAQIESNPSGVPSDPPPSP